MFPLTLQHIALSVRDIDRSADWYSRLFDLALVAEVDSPAEMKVFALPGGQCIDLRQDPDAMATAFSQRRVGLDHVAFACADKATLHGWHRRVQDFGANQSGLSTSPFGWHLNLRDPDGIPLEIFFPATLT